MNNKITAQERFDAAFDDLLEHEGGYSNNPYDPGGPTNFGITQKELTRVYKQLNLPEVVKSLTVDEAATYYKSQWWDKYHYEAINSLAIASKLFNMAVNMGPSAATRLIQESCNYLGYPIRMDGILGAETFGVINQICLYGMEEDLMGDLIDNQKWYYEQLVDAKPKLEVFLKGWLNRAAYEGA